MIEHKFEKFLEVPSIYLQNIEFWKEIVYTLLSGEGINFQPYLTTIKSDGTLYMDGNPIYNFVVKDLGRAVRIIQEKPESNGIAFTAWIKSTELTENDEMKELVISLELSNETTLMATQLISDWIVNKYTEPQIEKKIDKLFNLDNIMNVEFGNAIKDLRETA